MEQESSDQNEEFNVVDEYEPPFLGLTISFLSKESLQYIEDVYEILRNDIDPNTVDQIQILEDKILIFGHGPQLGATNVNVDPNCFICLVIHDEKFARFQDYLYGVLKHVLGKNFAFQNTQNILLIRDDKDLIDFEVDNVPEGRHRQRDIQFTRTNSLDDTTRNTMPSSQKCFNCLGTHNMRDCAKPRNRNQIEKNRNAFKNSKIKTTSRYHLDDPQIYGKFSPGVLSPKLREALSLSENQLPVHIYRMRTLGYPPGWLEDAQVSYSGVAVYDLGGIAEPMPGEEDGEILDEAPETEYDVSKIIEYPGFNVPAPDNTIDEHQKYNCSPIEEHQSKTTMLTDLMPNAAKAYKKRAQTQNSEKTNESSLPSTPTSSATSSYELESSSSESKTHSQNVGTPLINTHSPFNKLPDREKFSQMISDVINFDNLPNSTGTYEKVVKSIKRIREYNSKQAK